MKSLLGLLLMACGLIITWADIYALVNIGDDHLKLFGIVTFMASWVLLFGIGTLFISAGHKMYSQDRK